jgi:hypothetical protein
VFMETLATVWSQLGGVPWQQWAALSAAGWLFALTSFVAAGARRRAPTRPTDHASVVRILQRSESPAERRRRAA